VVLCLSFHLVSTTDCPTILFRMDGLFYFLFSVLCCNSFGGLKSMTKTRGKSMTYGGVDFYLDPCIIVSVDH